MPTLPPQLPTQTLPLSDSTLLQARIAALEARVAALEAVITQGADGLTISSRGNIAIKAGRDLSIRSERAAAIDVRGEAMLTVIKSMTLVAKELVISADDHYRLQCGSVAIDAKKGGDLLLDAARINVKGSSEVVIKGSKVTQN